MSKPPPKLPRVGRDLLAAYRDVEDIPADTRANIWARLQEEDAATIPAPQQPGAPRWLWPAIAVAAVAVLWWGLRTQPDHLAADPSSPQKAEAEDRADTRPEQHPIEPAHPSTRPPSPSPNEPVEAVPVPAPQPEPTLAPSKPAADPATRRRTQVPATEPTPETPPASSTLAQERALIQKAWTALAGDRPNEALGLAHSHERHFPHGMLTPEREALQTAARCKIEPGRAKDLADAFVRGHPRSPLVPRVRQACE